MSKLLKKRFLPAITWLIIIVLISGFPGDKVPEIPVWQFDKLVHSVVYAILSLTLLIAFYQQYQNPKSRLLSVILIIVFGIIYGGLMEILQHYIFINRSGNWYDFLANTFGSIIGVIIFPFVMKLLPINRWFNL